MNSLPRNWIFVALILHLLAAWISVSHYQATDYAQILNFTSSKGAFDAKILSGFLPFIAFALSKIITSINIESIYVAAIIFQIISTSLSLLATVIFIRSIASEISTEKAFKWTAFFLLFSWLFIFTNVRFSSEGWASSFLILALGLYRYPSPATISRFLLVGLCFGLAFLSHYQVGVALLGFGLWMLFINKQKPTNILLILFAGLFTLLLGAGFDWWLYGDFTISSLNYIHSLTEEIHHALSEPWWFNAHSSSTQLLPPLTILLPTAIIVFWLIYPRHPITWTSLPYVILHSLCSNKEMRFLYPILPLTPFMFTLAVLYLDKRFLLLRRNFFKHVWILTFWSSIFINAALFIIMLMIPVTSETPYWQELLGSYIKLL
jgi:GPI mannosyltransferase 3